MALLRRCLPVALLLASATAAAAQDPVPRDTTRAPVPGDTLRPPRRPPGDTIRVTIPDEAIRADTMPDKGPQDTLPPDSVIPAPSFPEFPQLGPAGFGPGVFVWAAEDLARWHGLSLEEF